MATKLEAAGEEATKAAAAMEVVVVTRVVETGAMEAWVRVATRVQDSGTTRAAVVGAVATVGGVTANQAGVREATGAGKGTIMEEAIGEGEAGVEEVATRATDSTVQVV